MKVSAIFSSDLDPAPRNTRPLNKASAMMKKRIIDAILMAWGTDSKIGLEAAWRFRRKKPPIKDVNSAGTQRKGRIQEVLKKYPMESGIKSRANINNIPNIMSVATIGKTQTARPL